MIRSIEIGGVSLKGTAVIFHFCPKRVLLAHPFFFGGGRATDDDLL